MMGKKVLFVLVFIFCFTMLPHISSIYAEEDLETISKKQVILKVEERIKKVESRIKKYRNGRYSAYEYEGKEKEFTVICITIAAFSVIGIMLLNDSHGLLGVIMVVATAGLLFSVANLSLFIKPDLDLIEDLNKFKVYLEVKSIKELNKPHVDSRGNKLIKLYDGKYYLHMDEKYDSIKTDEYTSTEYEAIKDGYIKNIK